MSQHPPTIQSTLAQDKNVTYIDTIQAYDQWADVSSGRTGYQIRWLTYQTGL